MPSNIICSPTGSGKTYQLSKQAVDILTKSKDYVLILVPSKDHIQDVGNTIADMLGTDDLDQYGIQMITAQEGDCQVGKSLSTPEIKMEVHGNVRKKRSRCLITHFTYMGRRGFATYYYQHLRWVDDGPVKKTHVIIDEVDAFVQSLKVVVENGGRCILSGNTYTPTFKCRANEENGSNIRCESCQFKPESKTIHFNQKFSHYEIASRRFKAINSFGEQAYFEKLRDKYLSEDLVQNGTNVSIRIPMNPNPTPPYFPEDGPHEEDFQTVVEDMIAAGYAPTMHISLPTLDEELITREEIIKLEDADRARVVYPKLTCDVERITTIDRRPFIEFKKAKSVLMLTATISPDAEDFLNSVLKPKKHLAFPDKMKMEKVTLIGTYTKLRMKHLADPETVDRELIYVTPTKSDAEALYTALQGCPFPVQQGISNKNFQNVKYSSVKPKFLIFHSMSTLSRGLNFGEYDTIIVDNDIHKPRCVQACEDLSTMRLREAAEQSATVIQAIGRVLRKNKDREAEGLPQEKFVLVQNLDSKEQFDVICAEVKKMALEFESVMLPKGTTQENVWDVLKVRSATGFDIVSVYFDKVEKMLSEGEHVSQIDKKLNRKNSFRKKLDPVDGFLFDLKWATVLEKQRSEKMNRLVKKWLEQEITEDEFTRYLKRALIRNKYITA